MSIPEEEAARLIEEADPEGFMEICFMNFRMYFGDAKLIKIWRILSIERFRNKRANDFFIKHLIDYPLEYQAKVFDSMIKKGLMTEADPMVIAREFYSFMLMVYLRYFEVECGSGTAEMDEKGGGKYAGAGEVGGVAGVAEDGEAAGTGEAGGIGEDGKAAGTGEAGGIEEDGKATGTVKAVGPAGTADHSAGNPVDDPSIQKMIREHMQFLMRALSK